MSRRVMLDLDRVEALNRDEPSTASRTLVPALVAELRAARAEIERLRTAAADERADVVAKACVLAEYLTRDHMPADDKHAGHMIYTLAEEFEAGAHVGAAKGGDHG